MNQYGSPVLGEPVELDAALAVADLGGGQLGQRHALALQEVGHLLAGGQGHHVRAGQVAKRKVRLRIVERHVWSAECAGREVLNGLTIDVSIRIARLNLFAGTLRLGCLPRRSRRGGGSRRSRC